MTKIEQKIPEGWSVKKLGDIGKICMCKRIFKEQTHNYGDVPFYKIGTFGEKADAFISWELFTEYKQKYSYPNIGDILISCSGTIGRTVIFNGQPSYFQDSNIVWINNNENILLNQYLFYLYNIIKWKSTESSTIARLYNDNIKNTKIYFPPLPEQEKIAGILSCWDDGIEKLSALIEKKKIQKKALMQQLLTGKHRLKGFSTPWHEVKLGDVFSIKKGQGLSKEELNPLGKNACILYGELYTTYNEVIYNIKSLTNVDSGITSQVGDILIPASTTTTGIDLANATALMVSGVLLGGDINILRCKIQSSPIFFAYLLTHIYKYDIAKLAQGMTIVHLYGEFIKKIKVFIPSDLAEQKAIAEILSKADEEIELLNKKLEAFKQEKKALMQQLLTGKIRVKVN